MEFVLWMCNMNRCDENGDVMLTEEEVKEVDALIMHRYMYDMCSQKVSVTKISLQNLILETYFIACSSAQIFCFRNQ
jgi:hypothetical protein